MRVISGMNRGQKLIEIEGQDIRPTTDRVKEAIFSMMLPYLSDETTVLDLFGGTGALAIEALSRGAKSATIVDMRQESRDVIWQNVCATRHTQQVDLVSSSALTFLEKNADSFSMIFIDPPYNKGLIEQSLLRIAKQHTLTKDGIIVVERDHTEAAPILEELTIVKEKKYGRTYITLYQYTNH